MLTKTILQGIPIFMMSALPVPKGVLQKIRDIQRDCLWGKGEEKKKWALVAWDKHCKLKADGGLGLHDPKTLSRVSSAKLWWRWLKDSTYPWAKLWKKIICTKLAGEGSYSNVWAYKGLPHLESCLEK